MTKRVKAGDGDGDGDGAAAGPVRYALSDLWVAMALAPVAALNAVAAAMYGEPDRPGAPGIAGGGPETETGVGGDEAFDNMPV